MLLFLEVLRELPWGHLRFAKTTICKHLFYPNIFYKYYLSIFEPMCLSQIMASGTDEALKSTGSVLSGTKHVQYKVHQVMRLFYRTL